MPYCPRCRFEYREGATRCPDSGIDLVEGDAPPPERHAGPDPNRRVAVLARVADPAEADVIKAILIEAGIPALVRRHGPITGELATVADGATHDYALVLVQESRLAEARHVLDEMRSAPFEWPEGMEPSDEDSEDDEGD